MGGADGQKKLFLVDPTGNDKKKRSGREARESRDNFRERDRPNQDDGLFANDRNLDRRGQRRGDRSRNAAAVDGQRSEGGSGRDREPRNRNRNRHVQESQRLTTSTTSKQQYQDFKLMTRPSQDSLV